MDDIEKQLKNAFKTELMPLMVGLRNELKGLGDKLQSIADKPNNEPQKIELKNAIEFPKEIDATIKNFPEQKEFPKEIKVEGLQLYFANLYSKVYTMWTGFDEMLKKFGDSVKENVFKVQVENPTPEVKFPEIQKVEITNHPKKEVVSRVRIENSMPNEAIPVILTSKNGRQFYEVLSQAIGGLSDIDLNPVKKLLGEIRDKVGETNIDVDEINIDLDDVEALLATTNSLLTDIKGFVDGVEVLITTSNSLLTSIDGKDFATETTLASVLSELTLIKGFVDGIETSLATIITNTTGLATQATLSDLNTKLPDELALSDAGANPTTTRIGANNLKWDEENSVWARSRMATRRTILTSSARTATTDSANQLAYDFKRLVVMVDLTALTGGGNLFLRLQIQDIITGNWFTVFESANINSVALRAYYFSDGASAVGADWTDIGTFGVAGAVWRVEMFHSTANSRTYSVSAHLLP